MALHRTAKLLRKCNQLCCACVFTWCFFVFVCLIVLCACGPAVRMGFLLEAQHMQQRRGWCPFFKLKKHKRNGVPGPCAESCNQRNGMLDPNYEKVRNAIICCVVPADKTQSIDCQYNGLCGPRTKGLVNVMVCLS